MCHFFKANIILGIVLGRSHGLVASIYCTYKFPHLSLMARDFLAIPATRVLSE